MDEDIAEQFNKALTNAFPEARINGNIHKTDVNNIFEARVNGFSTSVSKLAAQQTFTLQFTIDNMGCVVAKMNTKPKETNQLFNIITIWFVALIATIAFMLVNRSNYQLLLFQRPYSV